MNSNELKSKYLQEIINDKNDAKGEIKDLSKINLSKVIEYIFSNADESDMLAICADINSGRAKVGMDANTIKLITDNKDNETLKKFMSKINVKIDIDIDNLTDLSSKKFNELQKINCNIGNIYVNDGEEQAAKRGYSLEVYNKIINKAERMVEAAVGKLKNASEEERFMAIYRIVMKNSVYDYSAIKDKGIKADTSRNLQGFFCDGTSICAGTAMALEQLCKMNGIEAKYVEGMAKSKNMSKGCNHAWIRVKIDGKWYNADPTWDANKVGKPFQYCMKSDKDFDGHSLNNRLKPTYVRNSGEKEIKQTMCNYEPTDESISSSYLESKYPYEANSKARELTEDEITALNERADKSALANSNETLLTIILRALLGFGTWGKDKIKNIFNKNKKEFQESDIKNISSTEEAEKFAKKIHVTINENYEKEQRAASSGEKQKDDGPNR